MRAADDRGGRAFMNDQWHERIQRYVDGQSSAEEAAALEAALNEDAELRALYLDYMNLDVALGAAAEMATIVENEADKTTAFPAQLSPHYWRWLAATAACAALAVLAMLPKHRNSSRAQPDLAATISSTQ